MEYNSGNKRASNFNRPSAKRGADLKLRARLLPELHDTKINLNCNKIREEYDSGINYTFCWSFRRKIYSFLRSVESIRQIYYMASSTSGQYASNSVFWLATWAGKMERYCPPGTAHFVPANKISPKFKQVHESFLSPKLFSAIVNKLRFLCLYGTRKSVNENENKENKHNDEF